MPLVEEELDSRPHTSRRRKPRSMSWDATPVRRSHGTRSILLTVASFRTWRGSQVYAAWDPTLSIIIPKYRPRGTA